MADVQHILNLQDVCHLLHNTVKDIGTLPEYQEVRTGQRVFLNTAVLN